MCNSHQPAECRGIPSDRVRDVWGEVRPLIQKAIDRGSNYSISDIFIGLNRQQMQLWVWGEPIKTAMVTMLADDACVIIALAGSNMSEWIDLLPGLEEWARSKGCKEMQLYGRIGWAKVTGYDVQWTKMRKGL